MNKKNNTLKAKLVGTALAAATLLAPALSVASDSPIYVDQGDKWTPLAREQYYTQDQGSAMIPLKWINALKQSNGQPFLADNLSRYGYLPNPKSPIPGLAIGFTTINENGKQILGMTCSACHTRQIDVKGVEYRIDGGPAVTDMQTFMIDLNVAVKTVLANDVAFKEFATAVLGGKPTDQAIAALHAEVSQWYEPYEAIVTGSFKGDPWGPSRLDAVGMIFNRVSGLDIGAAPNYIIKENIKPADAPVRYPFMWNAPIQDFTQWPGFAPNGNGLYALIRNVGEVFGVFADFHPVKDDSKLLKANYLATNSADFHGLRKLEKLIQKIGSPKWPWDVNETLVLEGAKVYEKKDTKWGNQSCADCHGIKPGKMRSLLHPTWATPIMNVGTDTREYVVLTSTVKTGVLEGTGLKPLQPVDAAASVLKNAVEGSIIQHYTGTPAKDEHDVKHLFETLRTEWKKESEHDDIFEDFGLLTDFTKLIKTVADEKAAPAAPACQGACYESRVLEGIWAAAPYLHNGSVQSLSQLLTPSEQRLSEFKLGPSYDIKNVGLAAEQTKFNFTLKTTGCDKASLNSGSSHCGHDYGTGFTAREKEALLEYMKQL